MVGHHLIDMKNITSRESPQRLIFDFIGDLSSLDTGIVPMHKQLLLASLLSWLATNTAFAGTSEWTSSYTQGVEEHLVDDGHDNQLSIACPDDDESPVSAYATLAGKRYSSERMASTSSSTAPPSAIPSTPTAKPAAPASQASGPRCARPAPCSSAPVARR